MTVREVSTSLNISVNRVYYIFKKLGLKTQCKKEGRSWSVERKVYWKIDEENNEIEKRKHQVEAKKRTPEMQAYAVAEKLEYLCNKDLATVMMSDLYRHQSKLAMDRLIAFYEQRGDTWK